MELQLFGKKLEEEQQERIALELATELAELIKKEELSFKEAEPIIKKIFVDYSIKEPELARRILEILFKKYASQSEEPLIS